MSIEYESRPLSERQRKELEGYVAVWVQPVRVLLFVGFVVVLGAILRGIQYSLFDSPPVWIVVTGIIAVFVHRRARIWTGGRELSRAIRADLAAGEVRLAIIEPVCVTEIEEVEDEGPTYVIETADGPTVLLTGQEMYHYKKKSFPWSKFHIVEAPNSGMFFELENIGVPIEADRTAPPLSYEKAKALGCFEKNFIVLEEPFSISEFLSTAHEP